MHRRDFLKLGVGVGALAILPLGAVFMTPDEVDAVEGRRVLGMNQKWRFSPQRFENTAEGNFDDSGFEQVTLPHARAMTAGKTFLTYRRKFRLPLDARGFQVCADFMGSVQGCLTVWLNGQLVTIESKRFNRLRDGSAGCDITRQVNWAGENEMVVQVGPGPLARLIDFDFNYIYSFHYVQLRLMPQTHVQIIGVGSCLGPGGEPMMRVSQFLMCPGEVPAHLTTEMVLQSSNRVVATGQRPLDPRDKGHALVDFGVEPTDFGAGDWTNPPTHGRRYTLISRLKLEGKLIDEDVCPMDLSKRMWRAPTLYPWRHSYEIT